MDTVKINNVNYKARVVTLDMVDIQQFLKDGVINQKLALELSIYREDQQPIDWSTMPLGHSMKLIPLALKACGFSDNDEKGND